MASVNAVRLLLHHGACPHPQPSLEDPHTLGFQIPLFSAAEGGSSKCVKLLLQAGANANIIDYRGATALMFASTSATVHQLSTAGCDINAQDRWGQTALDHAAENHHHEVIYSLAEAGADI